MVKTLIGPQIRHIRKVNTDTQAEMARKLGVSAAYINLLENNQRSVSVNVLMALSEAYGIDAHHLVKDSSATQLADLRACLRDPMFANQAPDISELRAALDHAPTVVKLFLQLHANHEALQHSMRKLTRDDASGSVQAVRAETAIYTFFRSHGNHFPPLEAAAEAARDAIGGANDDLYANLKRHLKQAYGLQVTLAPVEEMEQALRVFDIAESRVLISEALDPVNRTFQLAHVLALVSVSALLETLITDANIPTETGQERCRVELANYFAAALLMPYDAIYRTAEDTRYDLDRIATRFAVSFEQVAQRLTTLQRKGAEGVPFFFLRIDPAGNVTKRFNATPFTLADQGGACPVWNLHSAFAAPDTILPQRVELPDTGQFFTISRTTPRPVTQHQDTPRRLVVTLGCEQTHAHRIRYADPHDRAEAPIAQIGINCHICPRLDCAQRAYEPLHVALPLDVNRRGTTRYQS